MCIKQNQKGKKHSTILHVGNACLKWKRQWFHVNRWGELDLRQLRSVSVNDNVLRVEGSEKVLEVVGLQTTEMNDLSIALMRWKQELLDADEQRRVQEMREKEEKEKAEKLRLEEASKLPVEMPAAEPGVTEVPEAEIKPVEIPTEKHDAIDDEEEKGKETAEEPVVIAEEPVVIAEEPVVIAEEPVVIAEEPKETTEEPKETTEEPKETTEEPKESTEEPKETTEEPAVVAEEKPAETTGEKPVEKPVEKDESEIPKSEGA